MNKKYIEEIDISDEDNVAVFVTCANPLLFEDEEPIYYFFVKNAKNEMAILFAKEIDRTFDKFELWFRKRGFNCEDATQRMLFLENDFTEYRIKNNNQCLSFGIKKRFNKYIIERTDLVNYAIASIHIDEKELEKFL